VNVNMDLTQKKPVPLQHEWKFHFESSHLLQSGSKKCIDFGEILTVQDFWRYYKSIKFEDMPVSSKLILYKYGVSPNVAHGDHKKGGCWVLIKKLDEGPSLWLKCILVLIGEQCTHNDCLLGTGISIRRRNCYIFIYNSSSDQKLVIEKTEKELLSLLDLPKNSLKYQSLSKRFSVEDEDDEDYGIKVNYEENSDSFSSPFVQLTKEFPKQKSNSPPRNENQLSLNNSNSHRRSQSVQTSTTKLQNPSNRLISNQNLDEGSRNSVSFDSLSLESPILPKRHKRKAQTMKRSTDNNEELNGSAKFETVENENKRTTIITTPTMIKSRGIFGIRKRHWVSFFVLIVGLSIYIYLYTEISCIINKYYA